MNKMTINGKDTIDLDEVFKGAQTNKAVVKTSAGYFLVSALVDNLQVEPVHFYEK